MNRLLSISLLMTAGVACVSSDQLRRQEYDARYQQAVQMCGHPDAAFQAGYNAGYGGNGMHAEWTELTYQKELAGNAGLWVFPISVLLVFLVLAALYESLTLPLVVILIVPMTLLSAIAGVWLVGGDNNIFTQIGLIVLVGLAAKNAILIVEFARAREQQGASTWDAIIDAARLRLRPILMTSIAFTAGVVPLVLAHGAGAEMRHAMGVAVFAGMIGVTIFGLVLTPVFYWLVQRLAGHARERAAERASIDDMNSIAAALIP